jgi:hypothetical protein
MRMTTHRKLRHPKRAHVDSRMADSVDGRALGLASARSRPHGRTQPIRTSPGQVVPGHWPYQGSPGDVLLVTSHPTIGTADKRRLLFHKHRVPAGRPPRTVSRSQHATHGRRARPGCHQESRSQSRKTRPVGPGGQAGCPNNPLAAFGRGPIVGSTPWSRSLPARAVPSSSVSPSPLRVPSDSTSGSRSGCPPLCLGSVVRLDRRRVQHELDSGSEVRSMPVEELLAWRDCPVR